MEYGGRRHPDALRALWVDSVRRSREALAEALSRGGLEQTTPNGMSLRRLLADMIEEYARHTGHADLLREQVDGVTGEGPPQDFPVPLSPGRNARLCRRPVRLALIGTGICITEVTRLHRRIRAVLFAGVGCRGSNL